jgi:hypothetical protein
MQFILETPEKFIWDETELVWEGLVRRMPVNLNGFSSLLAFNETKMKVLRTLNYAILFSFFPNAKKNPLAINA